MAHSLYSDALSRERMIRRAIIADTFETAITWERFEAFHDQVKAATEAAIRRCYRTAWPSHLPLYPCLSRRAGAVLLVPRAGATRCARGTVAIDQGRRRRRSDLSGWHNYASSRGRPGPSSLVRPPTPRPLRQGLALRQKIA